MTLKHTIQLDGDNGENNRQTMIVETIKKQKVAVEPISE